MIENDNLPEKDIENGKLPKKANVKYVERLADITDDDITDG